MNKYFDWMIKTVLKAGWAPVLVFTVHILAVRVLGIYRLYPNFDDIMHFSGGVVISYFFIHAVLIGVKSAIFPRFNRFLYVTVVFSYTTVVTALWEFLEWLSDFYLGTYLQNSISDTLLDMALGMTGGLIIVTLSLLFVKSEFFINGN